MPADLPTLIHRVRTHPGVVAKAEINTLIPELKDRGATGIIELPIAKIVH